MHYLSLAVLEIPEVQEDKERDREIAEGLEELRLQKELKGRSIQTGLLMERLRGASISVLAHGGQLCF